MDASTNGHDHDVSSTVTGADLAKELQAGAYWDYVSHVGADGRRRIFTMRALDLMELVFDGIIPLPLMRALDRLDAIRRLNEQEGPMAAMHQLTDDDRRDLSDLSRRYLLAASVSPKVVDKAVAACAPDEVSIAIIPRLVQFNIMTEGLTRSLPLTEGAADSFRRSEPAAPDPPASLGEPLRPEAVVVVDSPSAVDA